MFAGIVVNRCGIEVDFNILKYVLIFLNFLLLPCAIVYSLKNVLFILQLKLFNGTKHKR